MIERRKVIGGSGSGWILFLITLFAATQLNADWKATGPFGGDIEVVRVVPKVPGLVIAAARNGLLFQSTNGGAFWNNIPFPGEFTGVLHALLVDPRETGTWYAGMEGERSMTSGVYKTTDAGKTWTLLAGTKGKAIWSLAFWPGNPNVIAAGAGDGAYRSDDAGATWKRVSPIDNLDLRPVVSLAFDPRDASILYAGTTHLPWRTGDGGATWKSIHTGMLDDSDVFSIQIDPKRPELVYASACSGVYHSTDSAGHWSKYTTPPGAFRTYFVALDPRAEGVIFAGTTEGLLRSEDGGKIWRNVSANAVKSISFDPAVENRIFFASSTGGILVSTDGGRTLHDSNFGFVNRNFTAVAGARDVLYANIVYEGNGGVYKTGNLGLRWDHSAGEPQGEILIMAAVPDQPSILYAAGYRGLLRSGDGGKTWVAIKGPNQGHITSLLALAPWMAMVATETGLYRVSLTAAAASPQATWKQVSAQTRQLLQRSGTGPIGAFSEHAGAISRDEGLSWKACGQTSTAALWYGLTFNYQNSSVALAATSEGLFRSVDSCATWEKITQDLHAETVASVLFHPTRTNLAFASQGGRIFRSDDGGFRWARLNEDDDRNSWWPSALLVLPGAPDRLFALFPRRGIFSDLISTPDGGAGIASTH
ncbi:MAG TPA: hypothetical protein VEF06_02840 [Bryobacteraceae bacterium]|nr:hypothetical protein [Bryobacteraceae bacterium]